LTTIYTQMCTTKTSQPRQNHHSTYCNSKLVTVEHVARLVFRIVKRY
jgi:hypothetical protein